MIAAAVVCLMLTSLVASSHQSDENRRHGFPRVNERLWTRYRKLSQQGRLNSADDIRTVYGKINGKAVTVSQLADLENSKQGIWTAWINYDARLEGLGYGEYENCERIEYEQSQVNRCNLWCHSPVAAKYGLVSTDSLATWAEIEKCIGAMNASTCGITCHDYVAAAASKTACLTSRCSELGLGDQCTRCPDTKVAFFCLGTSPPPPDRCCPDATCPQSRSAPADEEQRIGDNEIVGEILRALSDGTYSVTS